MAQITAGVKLSYLGEATAGIEPSGTWIQIPGLTDMPEFGASPDTLENTSLDNLTYKTYTGGLLDTGGVISFKANDTDTFRGIVATMMETQGTLATAGKSLWFRIYIPAPINKHMSFQGKASPLGFGGSGVNSIQTITLNVVPTKEPTPWVTGA